MLASKIRGSVTLKSVATPAVGLLLLAAGAVGPLGYATPVAAANTGSPRPAISDRPLPGHGGIGGLVRMSRSPHDLSLTKLHGGSLADGDRLGPLHGMPAADALPHSQHAIRADALGPRNLVNTSIENSTNWSGLIVPGDGINGVGGDWTVPTVPPTDAFAGSGSWVGVDGYGPGDTSLIQTGTAQTSGGGTTSYSAWYEIQPAPPVILGSVEPGDQMEAAITQVTPGEWNIDIQDDTEHTGSSTNVAYNGPGDSAEWIEEDPAINGAVGTLADFGSVHFSNVAVSGTDLASLGQVYSYMVNASGHVIAYPTDFESSTHSFTVVFGAPPLPVVDSVVPAQGSTAGGTAVTINGAGFTDAQEVLFGNIPAQGGTIMSDGSITLISPGGPAGTVYVRVITTSGESAATNAGRFTFVTPAPPPPHTTPHGYWLVAGDGGVFTFGQASFHGSTGSLRLQRPVVGMTTSAGGQGYWMVATDGGMFAFGNAKYHGSIPGDRLHPAGSGIAPELAAPIVAMVASPTGNGYLLVASDGGVFAFGDALFHGSCPSIGGCSGSVVAVVPDKGELGYWVITSTGKIYAFGNAVHYGQPAAVAAAITGATASSDGNGYLLVDAEGHVYAYGDAHAYGSAPGGIASANRIVGIVPTSTGDGYWLAGATGAVYPFGDAPNDGSMAGRKLNAPIVTMAGF